MDRYVSHGMTPPAPGQEKEEPDLWYEDDIPIDQTDEDPGAETRAPSGSS